MYFLGIFFFDDVINLKYDFRSAKVSQKLFDEKKDDYPDQAAQQQPPSVYQTSQPQAKVVISTNHHLVENGQNYYQSASSIQPPPPSTTHAVLMQRGVKRPRTICPKPKEIELIQNEHYIYDDSQTMIVEKNDFDQEERKFDSKIWYLHCNLRRI